MADTRLYELEECVSPQADDILLIEESATQTDKKVKVSSLMPTDAVESAVADWLTAHPEATTTVEDGSITPVKLATSTMDLFDAKANTTGEYDDMTVGNAKQLLSKGYTENKTPYIYRASAGGDRVYEKLIGGTIAWNQIVQNGNFADTSGWGSLNGTMSVSNNILTITRSSGSSASNEGVYHTGMKYVSGHKYMAMCDMKASATLTNYKYFSIANTQFEMQGGSLSTSWNKFYAIASLSSISNTYFNVVVGGLSSYTSELVLNIKNCMLIDLTRMFGSTIADYIYSLEQATAGAGVAYFRQMFPSEYYAYDTGTLQSVNVASKKVYDSNNILVATYTFDSDLTLRGIPKLDASNNLYYDGDVYESDGSVTRKYGIVDLGSLEWTYSTSDKRWNATLTAMKTYTGRSGNIVFEKYTTDANVTTGGENKGCASGNYILIYTSDNTNTPTGLCLYELATPTTESADAYTNPQIVYADGTEEFVDYAQSQGTRDVAVPVGHESKYMINLRAKIEDAVMLPTLPTANRTYTLKCTVASGVPTLSWVAD